MQKYFINHELQKQSISILINKLPLGHPISVLTKIVRPEPSKNEVSIFGVLPQSDQKIKPVEIKTQYF